MGAHDAEAEPLIEKASLVVRSDSQIDGYAAA
jgi:hypothetical protein